MKMTEKINELFQDLRTALDELAGEALEVFHIEDIEDLKKDGELVPSSESTLNSVASEKSRKSKAPGSPIDKMRLFLYSSIKKSLAEIKENADKQIEENKKDIMDNSSEMTTAELTKKQEKTTKLKDKSNKLESAIEKVDEKVQQVESDMNEKIEKKEAKQIEKETKKDISNMFKTMKSIEQNEVQPISVESEKGLEESEKIVSENEKNLAYMVSAIKNNEEKEMQPIAADTTEVKEKTDEDIFNETMTAIDEVYRDAGIVVLSDIQEQYIAQNQKASTKAKDLMAKYMINQINEMAAMQQAYDQQLATQKAEFEAKYASLEQSTKQTIEQKDARINELEIAVSNYENVTKQKDEQIESQKNTIEENNNKIAELTVKVDTNEKEISARDTEIERLRQYERRFMAISEAMAPIANQQPVESTIEEGGKTK